MQSQLNPLVYHKEEPQQHSVTSSIHNAEELYQVVTKKFEDAPTSLTAEELEFLKLTDDLKTKEIE